jgi:hypothetical protein
MAVTVNEHPVAVPEFVNIESEIELTHSLKPIVYVLDTIVGDGGVEPQLNVGAT